jgi:EmrB/QacA subfamily drug resistance transporter
MSDRFGRKGALQAGLVLFALGSIASASVDTANQLIFTRAFMGVGGALIMPSTLSILTNVFRDPKERGRAIAIWAGFSGVAVALGPMTGGFLLEHFSWQSVFWVNVPVAATALILGAFIIPKSRDPRQRRLDPLGAVLSIAGLATLLFGIIEGPSKGWSSTEVLIAFGIAIVTLTAFVLWERHTESPMLDMSLFKNPRFTAASSTITLVFFSLFGSMFLITQYWQLVDGYSPFEAGVRLVPWALTMMIVAPLSARLVEKVGTKRIVLVGIGLVMVGLALASTIEPHTAYPQAISYFMVMAAGMAMTMAPATESVMGSLPREKAGVGSAVNDTTRQVGGALGVAIIGTVFAAVYSDQIDAKLARLTAARRERATESIEEAQDVAREVGRPLGELVLTRSDDAFDLAARTGFGVCVGVLLLAAVAAALALPSGRPGDA